MQIVIDINEEIFNKLPDAELGSNVIEDVLEAVENGTVLPKGHGRLIDADKAVREENSKLVDFETTNTRDRSYCRYARIILNDAPTIIEADVPKRRKGTPLEENDSGYNCENWIP